MAVGDTLYVVRPPLELVSFAKKLGAWGPFGPVIVSDPSVPFLYVVGNRAGDLDRSCYVYRPTALAKRNGRRTPGREGPVLTNGAPFPSAEDPFSSATVSPARERCRAFQRKDCRRLFAVSRAFHAVTWSRRAVPRSSRTVTRSPATVRSLPRGGPWRPRSARSHPLR